MWLFAGRKETPRETWWKVGEPWEGRGPGMGTALAGLTQRSPGTPSPGFPGGACLHRAHIRVCACTCMLLPSVDVLREQALSSDKCQGGPDKSRPLTRKPQGEGAPGLPHRSLTKDSTRTSVTRGCSGHRRGIRARADQPCPMELGSSSHRKCLSPLMC